MLNSVLEAVLLGFLQGVSEFIPISSSGHLVIAEELFNLTERPLTFDVALHVGTTAAVLAYFRSELALMARGMLGRDRSPEGLLYRHLGFCVLIASIPVGLVGLALTTLFERAFEAPLLAAGMLFITAALLFTGEHLRDRRVAGATSMASVSPGASGGRSLPIGLDPSDPSGINLDQVRLREAMLVGLAQCLALFPGISRSGTTIVAGMAVGLTREAAARFSFLLSFPVLVGASLASLPDLVQRSFTVAPVDVLAGVLTAFVSGYFAIRYLIALVSRDRLTPFAWYCIGAGTMSIILLLST